MNYNNIGNSKELKAITPKSKNKNDFQKIEFDRTWNDVGSIKKRTEFYCEAHAKDRLDNLCNQNTLTDLVLSGTEISFSKCDPENTVCKEANCGLPATVRIDRI